MKQMLFLLKQRPYSFRSTAVGSFLHKRNIEGIKRYEKTQLFSSRSISHTVVVRVAVFLLFFSSCKTSLVETEKLKGRVWRVMSHCEGALLDALMFPGLSQFSHSEKQQAYIKGHRSNISHQFSIYLRRQIRSDQALVKRVVSFLCRTQKQIFSRMPKLLISIQ